MATANVQPKSGTQLLIIVGAAFLILGIYTTVGMYLLGLGVAAWLVYNLINLNRQF